MDERDRIKDLIEILNKASYFYYNTTPIMTDYEWDKLYDELKRLERETGIIFGNSPTQNVGYVVSEKLKKVKHNHLMLSLDKTKNIDELKKFIENNDCIASVKCDGLTLTLRYLNGELREAETRGDGANGEDVLQNALMIKNIPKNIPYSKELIIDGEVIIDWNTFSEINEKIKDNSEKFKHPRNLVSGSLKLLSSKQSSERNMRFIAWRVIKGFSEKSISFNLKEAEKIGFEIVPFFECLNNKGKNKNLEEILDSLKYEAEKRKIPYDGAVIAVDSYRKAKEMGKTEKFFKHSIAYKYEDSLYETTLRNIEWRTSKTGLINPVAVFDPVDLGGAITTRATLHNITYIKNMRIGIGDRLRIYRSNMVIPKIHDSIDKTGIFDIPKKCPICGYVAKIVKENDSEVLICTNPNCQGKFLSKLSHFVSKKAINIDGLSEQTLQFLINRGWVKSFIDIYHLKQYQTEWAKSNGFGEKSVENILNAIEESRKTELCRFIVGLSIPLVGNTASKEIAKYCDYDFYKFIQLMTLYGAKCFDSISGIGKNIILSLDNYFNKYCSEIFELSKDFSFQKTEEERIINILEGDFFVITGNLNHFDNREAIQKTIEKYGGKISNSVSSKTSFLINNDKESKSSKNKKAKSLGIPVITEKEFVLMLKGK